MWKEQWKQDSIYSIVESRGYFGNLRDLQSKTEISQYPAIQQKSSPNNDLIAKILMLSIQLQRKERIIQELNLNHQKVIHQYEDMDRKYQNQTQQVNYLKNNLSSVQQKMHFYEQQNSRQRQSMGKTTFLMTQMQQKLNLTQNRLKRIQDQRIELQDVIKKLKVDNSNLVYEKQRVQKMDKSRVRELQYELKQEKSKYETEVVANKEMKFLLENYMKDIEALKRNQNNIRNSYEETIRKYDQQINRIKSSQEQFSMANDEKIILLSQQLQRLKEEVDYLRKKLAEKQQAYLKKQNENHNLSNSIGAFQNQYNTFQKQIQRLISTSHEKQKSIQSLKIQTATLKEQLLYMKQAYEQLLFDTKQKDTALTNKTEEIQSLRIEIDDWQKRYAKRAKSNYKQNMKLECQRCKMLLGLNTKNDNDRKIDLKEVIEQTEKLLQSNRKSQKILSKSKQIKIHTKKQYYHH